MGLSHHHLTELVVALCFGGAMCVLLVPRRLRPWLPVVVGSGGLIVLVVSRPGLDSVTATSLSGALALATVVTLPTTERFGRDAAPRIACLAMLVALGGVYATVPDTEVPLRLIGAMAPALVVGIVVSDNLPLRFWAAVPVPILIAVSISVGDRAAAAIAGVGCLGVALAEPIANVTVRPRSWLVDDSGSLALCTALQVAIVVACSRVVAPRSAASAGLLLAAILAASAVALRVRLTQVGPSPSRPAPRPG